jgi:hypothetical protein
MPRSLVFIEIFLCFFKFMEGHISSVWNKVKVTQLNPANKVPFATRNEAIQAGYLPCKVCKP